MMAQIRALTLVEVAVALTLMSTVMLGFIGAFMQVRRVAEASVLQSACTSIVYGLIEQMKGLDYNTLVPAYGADPFAPEGVRTPYIRLRVHQDLCVWLTVVHTKSSDAKGAPKAPVFCPSPEASAESVGAVDNFLGKIPLATTSGTTSQSLSLNLWVWIDEIPDKTKDLSEVKRITVVYSYPYQDGASVRIARDMEVFVRTRYDQ
jgi:Tfp pilus assembly protein PilV